MDSYMKFEDGMRRIEEIASLLEKKQTDLAKTVELYEEGISLLGKCAEILDNAEQKVEILKNSYSETPRAEPFQGDLTDDT